MCIIKIINAVPEQIFVLLVSHCIIFITCAYIGIYIYVSISAYGL